MQLATGGGGGTLSRPKKKKRSYRPPPKKVIKPRSTHVTVRRVVPHASPRPSYSWSHTVKSVSKPRPRPKLPPLNKNYHPPKSRPISNKKRKKGIFNPKAKIDQRQVRKKKKPFNPKEPVYKLAGLNLKTGGHIKRSDALDQRPSQSDIHSARLMNNQWGKKGTRAYIRDRAKEGEGEYWRKANKIAKKRMSKRQAARKKVGQGSTVPKNKRYGDEGWNSPEAIKEAESHNKYNRKRGAAARKLRKKLAKGNKK